MRKGAILDKKLGVGVIGTNDWARKAHLPGYASHERVELVAVCDTVESRAREAAELFGALKVYTDYRDLLADPEISMVDVCTPTDTHLAISMDVIGAGRHVLCEKPLAADADGAFAAAAAAKARGLRTKLGFTFRFSPAIRQIKSWIDDGTIGDIFQIQGFEQNYQFLDPDNPLRQIHPKDPRGQLIPSGIILYGSHLVDLMRWFGGEFRSVCASMRNFIPQRRVRGLEDSGRQHIPVEDSSVAIVEFARGSQGLLQSSYISICNYPGIEIRVYGTKGAAIARLVSEFGVMETLRFASASDIEFRKVELPYSRFPPGTTVKTEWPELYYRNLIRHFIDEIVEDRPQQSTFHDGAKSREIIDALIASHFERRWIDVGTGA